MSVLRISDLHVSVGQTPILKGVDLSVNSGEVHAIMGPNGGGKSTLAATIAGHPSYVVDRGAMVLDELSLNDLSPDQRAAAGLFLAFQYPVEVAGVRVNNFLKAAYQARFAGEADRQFPSVLAFRQHLEKLAETLHVKKELLSRGLNEGFSGGEKKRLEILQMALLEPKIAILDETDSGLDVDAIKAVAEGVKHILKTQHTGIIVITHYQRILKYLEPNVVHVMVGGKIAKSGGKAFAEELETKGYKDYV